MESPSWTLHFSFLDAFAKRSVRSLPVLVSGELNEEGEPAVTMDWHWESWARESLLSQRGSAFLCPMLNTPKRLIALSILAVATSLAAQDEETTLTQPAETNPAVAELRAAHERLVSEGESMETLEALGDSYLRLGDARAAVTVFQKAIDDFGGSEELYAKLARVMVVSGRPDMGVKVLQVAAETYPEHAGIQFELARSYERDGKRFAAFDAYRKASELDPAKAIYRYHLAMANASLGKWDDGLELVDQLLVEDGSSLPVKVLRGELLLGAGRVDEALDYLNDLLDENLQSQEVKVAWVRAKQRKALGEALAGRSDEAVEILEEAIALLPDRVDSRASLAALMLEKGDLEKAEEQMQHLLKSNPDELTIYGMYAGLLMRMDRKEEAASLYQKGLKKARELGDSGMAEQFQKALNPSREKNAASSGT